MIIVKLHIIPHLSSHAKKIYFFFCHAYTQTSSGYNIEVILRIINSQITKAHNYLYNNYISISLFNSFSTLYKYIRGQHCCSLIAIKSVKWKVNIFCKLVGISEAIRLILIYLFVFFCLCVYWCYPCYV